MNRGHNYINDGYTVCNYLFLKITFYLHQCTIKMTSIWPCDTRCPLDWDDVHNESNIDEYNDDVNAMYEGASLPDDLDQYTFTRLFRSHIKVPYLLFRHFNNF